MESEWRVVNVISFFNFTVLVFLQLLLLSVLFQPFGQ